MSGPAVERNSWDDELKAALSDLDFLVEVPPANRWMEDEGLCSLVVHRTEVRADLPLEELHESLKSHHHEYVGVVEEGFLAGIVSRSRVLEALSERHGFTLFSRDAVKDHVLPDPLIVREETPIMDLLELTLIRRTGAAFQHDVALTDTGGRFLGLISTEALVRAQWTLSQREKEEAEARRLNLKHRNEDLFRSIAELRQSEARYRILFENEALGVALLNSAGRVEAVNHRFQEMTRTDPKPGGSLGLRDYLDPHRRVIFDRLLRSENSGSCEFVLHLPGGESRVLRIHQSRIPESGQTALMLDDLTRQRKLEIRMARTEKSLMLDSLAGGIAHELNNKLAPVMGLSQFLAQAGESLPVTEVKGSLATIETSARDAARIIRQLLQLAQPPAAELNCHRFRPLVEGALEILRFELHQAGCHLTFDCCGEDCMVRVDPAQFRQVLVNLLLHARDAVQASERKEVRVRIRCGAEVAVVEVADTGSGIPDELKEKIFEPFFADPRGNQSSGLGLSVCANIVRAHGGRIEVIAPDGGGAVMRVTIPRAEASESLAHPAVEHDAAFEASGIERVVPPDGSPLPVLIVDDDPFIILFLMKALTRDSRLNCVSASGGAEAIELLRSGSYELIISDVRMPGVDGFGLYAWVTQNAPDMRNRFVFITGDAGGGAMNERLESMAVPVVRKPFVIEELTAQCFRLLKRAA